MLCEICKEREANVVFTEVINGKVTEHHICMECARNSDFGQQSYAAFLDGGSHLGRLLSGLLGMALNNSGEDNPQDGQSVVCPVCKTSYKDFVNRSRFGCADCYDVFELLMEDHIKNLQGNTNHVGKRPMRVKSRVEKEDRQMNTISAEDEALLQEIFGNAEKDAAQTEGNAAKEQYAERTEGNAAKEQYAAQTKSDAAKEQYAAQTEDVAAEEKPVTQMEKQEAEQISAVTSGAAQDPRAVSAVHKSEEQGNETETQTIVKEADQAEDEAELIASRTKAQINVLKKQLKRALEEENYMNAAHLRDQIHALEAALQAPEKEGGAS